MPRPIKKRRVCSLPDTISFKPVHENDEINEEDAVIMTLDEYEVIRLLDYKGLTQEEAAVLMAVARTTVQSIYSEGRKKIATAIVESKPLMIKGGNFKLSFDDHFSRGRHRQMFGLNKLDKERIGLIDKMKIVLPVREDNESTKISENLGRANYYMIYNLEDNTFEFIDNNARKNPSGAGIEAAQILVDTGARVLITPRCGMKAGKVLDAAGFEIYTAASESIKENIEKYRNEELKILKTREKGKHGGK